LYSIIECRMKWFFKVLNQYADFKGRASRKEYWMFTLFNFLAALLFSAIGLSISVWTKTAGASFLPCLYLFIVLIPGIAVTVRRLHDTGRSAWFSLVSLIPIAGALWLLLVMTYKGDPEDNLYGKNPVTSDNFRYNKKRSAAVALIFSSILWLMTFIILFFTLSDWDLKLLFSFFLPVCLLMTSVYFFSVRRFSTGVAWLLIVFSMVWLIRDFFSIRQISSSLLINFDIQLVISQLEILIPLGLLLSGFFILFKQTDRTIPACLLFVGCGLWIISLGWQISRLPMDFSLLSAWLLLGNNAMVITVPASLMVFARTFLSKEKTQDENLQAQPVTVTNEKSANSQILVPIEQPDITAKPNLVQKQPEPTDGTVKLNPAHKQPIISDPRRNVVFLREDRDDTNIWVVFKARSKVDAMAFLSKQTINRPSFFIVVETPEGNFGRDKDGFYQE